MNPKILIGPSTFGALDPSPLEALERAGCQVVPNPYGRKLTKEELLSLLPGVSGLIAGLEPVDREVLNFSDLRVISRCGSGLSNVDLKAAESLAVPVYSTPFGPTQAVAELTLGMILTLLRNTSQMDHALKNKAWDKRIGHQLQGKRVLLVGFGRIGNRVFKLLQPFGVDIAIADPAMEEAPRGASLTSLADALPWADIISIHASGEECLLDAEAFDRMKPGAFLCNAARGGLLDEQALVRALDDGTVAGAWLDCFAVEPYNGPLCDRENVLLTPHVGSYTRECRLQMEMESVENLLKGLERFGMVHASGS